MTDESATRAGSEDSPARAPSSGNRWLKAGLVGLHRQSRHSRTLVFRVPGWTGHAPGQHVDVRLTAADGYSAQRSYSLADPATTPDRVTITVDLLRHGEVSPYLVETMEIGDELDVRGPIGGWFTWTPGDSAVGPGPVLLIAGGSGVVPLMTMLRARERAGDRTPTLLAYSLRGPRDLMYGPELNQMVAASSGPDSGIDPVEIRLVYTRVTPDAHPRPASHLGADDIMLPSTWPARLAARVFVCGSSDFVEHATGLLRAAGYPDDRIRTERFGPTGADR